MLGAWLFAFALGVAHACVGGELFAFDPHPPHAAVPAGTPLGEDANPACAKFCADDIPVVAKVKAAQDFAGDLAPPLAFAVRPAATPAESPLEQAVAHAPARPGVPLRLRFLRLTL